MKRYFVDTNYFLRLLLKDNEVQFQKVYDLFQKSIKKEVELSTSIIVIFEIYWVLKSFYKEKKQEYCEKIKQILKMDFVDIENREVLQESISLFENCNLEFEDCYNIIYAKSIQGTDFASFDEKAVKYFLKQKGVYN